MHTRKLFITIYNLHMSINTYCLGQWKARCCAQLMQQLWESGHHMYLLCFPLWPSRSCSSGEGICAITNLNIYKCSLSWFSYNSGGSKGGLSRRGAKMPLPFIHIAEHINITLPMHLIHHDSRQDVLHQHKQQPSRWYTWILLCPSILYITTSTRKLFIKINISYDMPITIYCLGRWWARCCAQWVW